MSTALRLEQNLGRFERFRLDDANQIHSVLRELGKRGALLAVFPQSATTQCHVSRIRSTSQTGIDLIVDEPALRDPRIFARADTTAVAFLDQYKVQFPLDSALEPTLQGENVIHVCRPSVLYRIQRREGFRVKPQPDRLAHCNVRLAAGRVVSWPIIDLSVVGVALSLPPATPLPTLGTIWRFCVLQIDTLAPVPVDLIVTVVAPNDGADTATSGRIGCAFDRVPAPVERRLQRTVIELERGEIQARRASSLT
jgi:flagellar brake protein